MTDRTADIAAVKGIAAVQTILEMVCHTTGMGFAAVGRITEDRWVACEVRDTIAFGLEPGGELRLETTLRGTIRQTVAPIVIDHVAQDHAYRDHPTPALYGFQSYVSMPIVLPSGHVFGTLCAVDPKPARVNTPAIVGTFKLFAELIAFHLDAQERLAASDARLTDERQEAELREQFIAVLGHDLRNPLAAIDAGTNILLRTPLNDRATTVVGMMRQGIARMASHIDDVMDFAQGRLGSGLRVNRSPVLLEPALRQVVGERQTVHATRRIVTDFTLDERVTADSARVAQLLSNLLSNALAHGAPGTPIRVRASTPAGAFELAVENHGAPIPPETMARLFQPFARSTVRPSQQGLGLGLYIASEIAKAHAGTLTASSDEASTVFCFRMPIA